MQGALTAEMNRMDNGQLKKQPGDKEQRRNPSVSWLTVRLAHERCLTTPTVVMISRSMRSNCCRLVHQKSGQSKRIWCYFMTANQLQFSSTSHSSQKPSAPSHRQIA
ncbi:hypothetical protein T01_14999 [Trichinella spiralis]|uniref:Uncharacterized protein n=1 Tax=Trichinella spiralis TaxID=6334 RepID=A0A0V1BCM2_TRISP|nr:hypothetical protein T01_14999 [Trichinella spiralis]